MPATRRPRRAPDPHAERMAAVMATADRDPAGARLRAMILGRQAVKADTMTVGLADLLFDLETVSPWLEPGGRALRPLSDAGAELLVARVQHRLADLEAPLSGIPWARSDEVRRLLSALHASGQWPMAMGALVARLTAAHAQGARSRAAAAGERAVAAAAALELLAGLDRLNMAQWAALLPDLRHTARVDVLVGAGYGPQSSTQVRPEVQLAAWHDRLLSVLLTRSDVPSELHAATVEAIRERRADRRWVPVLRDHPDLARNPALRAALLAHLTDAWSVPRTVDRELTRLLEVTPRAERPAVVTHIAVHEGDLVPLLRPPRPETWLPPLMAGLDRIRRRRPDLLDRATLAPLLQSANRGTRLKWLTRLGGVPPAPDRARPRVPARSRARGTRG